MTGKNDNPYNHEESDQKLIADSLEKKAAYPRCKRARKGAQNYMAIENYNINIII